MTTTHLIRPTSHTTRASTTSSAFPATRWTWVREVQQGDGETISELAMERLCAAYWYPVYVTARRKSGLDHHTAEDVAQAFWSWFITHEHLRDARPSEGKFRNFLSSYLENFLRNELRAMRAEKRGGKAVLISKDSEDWSVRYEAEMGRHASPDEHLDAAWRRAGVDAAFAEVETAWTARGKGAFFEAMKAHLKGGGERGGYAIIAAALNLSEENVRQLASQLKRDLKSAYQRWVGE